MTGFLRGEAIILALALAASASAGLPIRNDEGHVHSVLDQYKRPQGFVPTNLKAVWARFVESAERSRGVVPRPAVRPAGSEIQSPDLGDDFLSGFARERGLRRKVRSLSGYLATLGRARRWLETLNPEHRQPLAGAFQALSREARAAETILIRQVGADMRRGGKAIEVLVDHVQRVGYAESTARDAFGGLTRGLKIVLTQVIQGGSVTDDERQMMQEKLTVLSRLVEGN